MKERGAEFVRFISYGKNDGFVDTLYAQGITIGKDVQRGPVDDLMVKHANAFLDLIKASGEKP
ncbi:hypothetical protein WK57_17690 [Burkholderia ubonensis]|uniref:Uncharacterized protein n=2 Tax=Burkholderia ubonensis TaxID=101571 RepID=A0AA40R8L4_9BURK|nr:hypothetical protein WL16_20070 [Burkholderia ubonensis]KWZ58344.1 hypothetical protein WK57_17690 [Burkholderia ubonensis]